MLVIESKLFFGKLFSAIQLFSKLTVSYLKRGLESTSSRRMLIRATDYDNILLKDSVFLRLGLIISCLSIVLHASSLVLLDSNFIDWIYKGWEFKPLRMTGDRVSFALGGMGYLPFISSSEFPSDGEGHDGDPKPISYASPNENASSVFHRQLAREKIEYGDG